MALPQIYSRRKRVESGATPDVFTYDDIAGPIKISLFHTMKAGNESWEVWQDTRDALREDLGVYALVEGYHERAESEVGSYFNHVAPVERVLDTIELWHHYNRARHRYGTPTAFTSAVAKINARLLENGIGFELRQGRFLEKSNEFAHQEIVVPALRLLSEQRFQGANAEFRAAHECYRAGDYKSCLVECLKAFESVVKVIAVERNWTLPPNPNAKHLIDALFANQHIPAFMQSQFNALSTLLESSVPTTRNKVGAHGQGDQMVVVPKSLAAFQLHQTAAVVIFLSEPS